MLKIACDKLGRRRDERQGCKKAEINPPVRICTAGPIFFWYERRGRGRGRSWQICFQFRENLNLTNHLFSPGKKVFFSLAFSLGDTKGRTAGSDHLRRTKREEETKIGLAPLHVIRSTDSLSRSLIRLRKKADPPDLTTRQENMAEEKYGAKKFKLFPLPSGRWRRREGRLTSFSISLATNVGKQTSLRNMLRSSTKSFSAGASGVNCTYLRKKEKEEEETLLPEDKVEE